MNYSSKRSPCLVCGRNTDDKCRSSATRMYCYVGDSFSPPRSLRIGDKIKIAGQQWRLFSTCSGFAQNSFAFALYEGDEYKFLSYEDKREFRKNCIRLTRLFLQKQKTVNSLAHLVKSDEFFQSMNIDEFYKNKANAKSLLVAAKDFMDFSFTNKRYLVDSGVRVEDSKALFRQVKDQLGALHDFERLWLGTDSPEAGDLRPEAFVF